MISLSNNLHYLKKEDRKFTTAIHLNKANKYLVAYSQDKEHINQDKLNKYAENKVTLLLDITKLSSYLKPKENQILMKITKSIKGVTE